ncbi:MAG: DMT family transporter [Acidithiobacillus sp.]|nr:DMT family transporter [Acidithiobacillus sp.]
MAKSWNGTETLPVLSLLLGAGLWGTYWWPLYFFSQHGLGGPWLVALLYLFLSILGGGWLLLGKVEMPALSHWPVYLALAFFGGWTNVAFMLALFRGPVVVVLLLFYLSPVWSVVLARFWLRESVPLRGWLGVGLALLGCVLVVLNQHHDTTGQWDGWILFLGLSSGFAFSLTNVVLRGADYLPDGARAVVIWWGCASLALLVAVFTPWPDHPHWQISFLPLFSWFWVGLATITTVYGVSRLPLSLSALIMPMEVIVGAASAWILAGQAMTIVELMGAALILSASVLMVMGRPS